MNMEQDDDTQQEVSIPEAKNGTLIPDGPYPPITEGTINYFDSSPQVRLSHFQLKKGCYSLKNDK